MIKKEIKRRTGRGVPKRIVVRVRVNENTDMKEVEKVVKEMLKGCGVCIERVRYMRRRVRVVMTREKNIKEILVNHKKKIEEFTERRLKCVCGGRKKHGARRGSEWECGRDEVFRVHCKHVLRPNKESAKRLVEESLSDLWRWISKEKGSKWVGDKKEKKAEKCVVKGVKREWIGVKLEDVNWVRKKMEKRWVITWLDKNGGELFVCCLVWYWRKVKGIFDWKGKEVNYERVKMKGEEVMKGWREEMKWWRKEEEGGEIPVGYAVPKEKDIEKMRPIVSYAKHPWKIALNTTAQIIVFLLRRMGLDETVIWRMMDVKKIVGELNEWSGETRMMVGDIKNMYTELPHKEIIEVIEWLVDRVKGKVRGSKWLRVEKRGRGGGGFGRGEVKKGWVELKMRDIVRVVMFDLNNCYIRLGDVIVQQKWGIPMGSLLSPILVIVICVKYETVFGATLGVDNRLKIKRFMDDVWVIGKYKRGNRMEEREIDKAIIDFRTFCYHERMIIETEGVQEMVEFLECKVSRVEGRWECEYRVKNEEREEKKMDVLKKFVEYGSYGDRRKVGIVMGAMARVEQNCSEKVGILTKGLGVVRELHRAGYPNGVIKIGLQRMSRKGRGGKMWRKVKELIGN
jgi:hypothetical protein